MVEAAILLSQGYSERDIDKAAVDFGMPMGPLRLTDEVGLDIAAKVASMMVEAYGKRMEGPKFAETLLNLGRKGKKTGQGFYNYPEREAVIDPELRSILKLQDAKEILESKDREMLQKRLVLRLVNEAVLCLDEGVAGFPGPEAAGQIDLASVMGIGFAPFRGGIIRYAEMFGSHNIYKSLCELAETEGKRYEPCKGVVIRAQDNRSFYQAL
jgi:3-hydroxyacyl-CoA dehydrogenase/enoyl-CoA hydratase/3-hydroxybutyryl-CoA epimerase